MKRETARELLIPYLDGELDSQTAALLEQHLSTDAELQHELEQLRELATAIKAAPVLQPDPSMRADFDALLREAKHEQQSAPRSGSVERGRGLLQWFSAGVSIPLAAAACLALGLGVGWYLAGHDDGQRTATDRATLAEMEALRRDVSQLRGILVSGALSNQSASYRLQTMSLAGTAAAAEPGVLEALFTALEGDPSPNVRLAALEALASYRDQNGVRSRLALALPKQTDPFVQIALIGLLVDAGVTEAREPIERLLLDPGVQPVVKGAAQQGLTRL